MCLPARFTQPAEAITALDSALEYLASLDVASMPAAAQAGLLQSLERSGSRYTAARAAILAAFMAQAGYEHDGQGSARAWLTWQTQVTTGAAAGAVGWARRLRAHPVIGDALAAGQVSTSWAKLLCEWTDRLPADKRDSADEILSGAAAGGAHLTDLAALAQEMYQRTADPAEDTSDVMDARSLRLGITFGGTGRAEADLTPGCAAALSAVLDSLGKKAGPEDIRTATQRRHDALYEACRRLIRGGMLPGRAGQPTQVQVHMSLHQLLRLPTTSEAERAWATASSARPGWLTGPEADAAACDATVIPVVTGQVDWSCLDQFASALLAGYRPARAGSPSGGHGGALSPAARQRLRMALLGLSVRALSGPGGLAARLRTGLRSGPLASVSLPLDVGAATETIPAHLRRAAALRHPHCAFPGCGQPASACDIHHIVPRCRGGPTALHNLIPLCTFHHLVAVHQWGWVLRLEPDGTTTATSPGGQRTLHSHGPPGRAA